MRKYTYLAAAAAAALVVSVATAAPTSAAPSAAGEVLTYVSPTGPGVAVNDVLTSSLAAGTLATFYSTPGGSTGVECSVSNFSATVTSNPSVPGTATERLDAQTFSSCVSKGVFGVLGVQSVTVNLLPYGVTADSTTQNVVISNDPIRATVKLSTLLGSITCVYEDGDDTMTGTTDDSDNSITFTDEQFVKVSGPNLCFGVAYLDAKYGPVVGPGGPVFVNS